MSGQCFSMVRGRVMRATRLDGCGQVVSSGCSSITTDGFVSVAFTAVVTEGETISVTNASGRVCVQDTGSSSHDGYTLVITFCEVNPDLYAMITGQATVYDTSGSAVGFRVNSGINPTDSGFALELWSNVPGVACDPYNPNAQGSYGYVLVPFIQGGVLGDFTLENNAITFTIQGASTKTGSGWGTGPYDVVPSVAGTNEVQTVTVSGSPTGGSYTLSFAGQTTGAIAYNANAAAIQTALEGLSNVGDGNILVGGTGPYTATFRSALGQRDVPQMTATSSLTGGTSPTVAVTTTTPGVGASAGPLVTPIGAKDFLHVQLTSIAPPSPGCSCTASGPDPTGATAGTPGTWTPTDAYPAANFAALSGITASPSSAWTSGQYMVLEDGSYAYWNSSAWVVGIAP